MSVTLRNGVVHLEGPCRAEEAETLFGFLRAGPAHTVDLTAAGALHTAVAQVLLALRPDVIGPAGDSFTELWIVPILGRQPR